jgi:hypothetical protein
MMGIKEDTLPTVYSSVANGRHAAKNGKMFLII